MLHRHGIAEAGETRGVQHLIVHTVRNQVAMRRKTLRVAALLLLLTGGVAVAIAASPDANNDILQSVIAQVDAGDFAAAEAAIASALATAAPAQARELEYQRERMRRIRMDFDHDADDVRERVRRQIPDLTEEEFARWDAQGLFERMDIDGQRLYFDRTASNLFRISAEARARRADPKPFVQSPLESVHPHHRAVVAGTATPNRVRIVQSLSVDADAVPAGETVRAWIPYPRAIPGQQEDIVFVASEPAEHVLAPESALQRTIYFEKPAVAGEKTAFQVTYELTIHPRRVEVDADKVVPAETTAELAPFVAERAPHVVFTDDLREFSRQVVGDEKNPWKVAQKLFAAVDRIPWAGAREYSTITNISDYALHAGHADCGQQTLLLVALLRLNGIPARWQSGMMFAPNGYWNLHDWGQLYIAPYGWMPMDVTFGRLDDADPAVAGFYLGGLDAWRIAFNDDYSRPFEPAKTHFRSETVDLQRGEAEWRGGNLYFDQWDYDFVASPQQP